MLLQFLIIKHVQLASTLFSILQDEDLVSKNNEGKYFVIDPLIKDALAEFEAGQVDG